MEDVRKIKIFISSPNDLQSERELVAEVCGEISQDIGSHRGFVLDPVRWETHTISARADRSQEAINQQTVDYDVYLGLMGFRFGSDTGKYASGTEEEYVQAIQKNKALGLPAIQFYFSDAKVRMDAIDLGEYEKVKAFRRQLSDDGVYYRKFEDLGQLRILVRNGLVTEALQLVEQEAPAGPQQIVRPTTRYVDLKPYDLLKNLKQKFAEDPLVSSQFLIQEAILSMDKVTKRLEAIGKRTNRLTGVLKSATKKSENLDLRHPQSAHKALRILEKVISEMEAFTHWFAYEIPRLDDDFSTSMSELQRACLIMKSSGTSEDEYTVIFESAASLKREFGYLADSVLMSGEAIPKIEDNLPRWEGNRRIYVSLTKDFKVFVEKACNTIEKLEDTILS